MIHIRAMQENDCDAGAALLRQSIIALCAADHQNAPEIIEGWTANKTPRHLQQWLGQGNVDLFVAFLEGDLAGVGASGRSGEILLNYVSPQYRFRGVSKSLLNHMEHHLIEKGLAEARLFSTKTAYQFYQSAGYVPSGPSETTFGLTSIPMTKPLADGAVPNRHR